MKIGKKQIGVIDALAAKAFKKRALLLKLWDKRRRCLEVFLAKAGPSQVTTESLAIQLRTALELGFRLTGLGRAMNALLLRLLSRKP